MRRETTRCASLLKSKKTDADQRDLYRMTSSYTAMPSKADAADDDFDSGVTLRPSRRIPLKIIIGLLAVLLIAVTAVSATFVVFYVMRSDSSSDNNSNSNSNVCQTEACFDLSVQIKGAMDETADPCNDFYNFTCGNWAFFNHITPGLAGYDALTIQQYAVYGELADILEKDFNHDENKVLTELQDLYDSCIIAMVTNISASYVPAIRKFYHDLGGWGLVNIPGDGTVWGINSTQFIREKRLGDYAFYSLDVTADEDLTNIIPEIGQAGLTLDYPSLYTNTTATDLLVSQIVKVLSRLAQPPIPENITDAAMDIVQFETNLAEIWEDEIIDFIPGTIYTVEELHQLWPDHDWLNVLKGVFAPSGVVVHSSSKVSVTTPDYFRNLTSLIRATPVKTLENYAKWQGTWELSSLFTPDSVIRDSIIEFKEVVMGKPSLEQRQECVEAAGSVMPIALGRVYAQYILPSGYKEAGMELVSQVREGLRQRMMEVDWLDSTTRQRAIEKLEAIDARVAYPEKTFDDNYLESLYGQYNFNMTNFVENFLQFLNISRQQQLSVVYKPPDRTQWLDAPTTVNAYYFPPFNQITILEAIMQTPSFSTAWPLSMQYGALGMVLGHELTHGFDNEGRQFDKDGRIRMWWTEKAVEAFNNRAQCFVEQYNDYKMFGITVDGNYTLAENIADNGGIRASYDAYKKVADDSKSLPGLSDYTNDQLFFIAFAQIWCSYTTQQSFLYSVWTDEHSPDPIRVLGTLSNNEDFARAYNCSVNDVWNPRKKCVLW